MSDFNGNGKERKEEKWLFGLYQFIIFPFANTEKSERSCMPFLERRPLVLRDEVWSDVKVSKETMYACE